jgi:hypothetical protein
MKLRLVPARQGLAWVRQGLRVFFRRPLAFSLLFVLYMIVGPSLMLAVAPLATIGFMIATQQALQGRFPLPVVFIEPLRAGRARCWAQLRLGIAYAVSTLLLFWLGNAIGGDAFNAVRDGMSAGKTPQEMQPLLADPALQAWWLVLVGGVSLLAVPFWYAPALIHWGGQGTAKALFFSTVACWRNKGALSVFALGWAVVMVAFTLLSTTAFALLGVPRLAMAAIMPAALMLSAAFYASLYFTFTDCFDAGEPAPAP